MYTLTGIEPCIGCYGTSYPTFKDAQNYAMEMQKLGLCLAYSIGQYKKEGHVRVFEHNPNKKLKIV